MKKIKLTKGKFAIVDDEDYDELSKFKWYLSSGYAIRKAKNGEDRPRSNVCMHRVIMKTPIGYETDHINHDRLDNRRCNLRVCTPSDNQRNTLIPNPSGYHCVIWNKRIKRWYVIIRKKYLGCFKDKQEAINVVKNYDKLNPPPPRNIHSLGRKEPNLTLQQDL